jgi:hypothetical protein
MLSKVACIANLLKTSLRVDCRKPLKDQNARIILWQRGRNL